MDSEHYDLVPGPNGPIPSPTLARPDLPPVYERWSPVRKGRVVAAVQGGVLSAEAARERYKLTAEELSAWQDAFLQNGVCGLRAKDVGERRRASRRSVHAAAEVVVTASATVGCTITDISAMGARLELLRPLAVPKRVSLRCVATSRTLWVTVVWQRKALVGVCFDRALAPRRALESGLDVWLLGE